MGGHGVFSISTAYHLESTPGQGINQKYAGHPEGVGWLYSSNVPIETTGIYKSQR
jgi:hypothetical protein